ncbi:unnamed protein product [Cylicocyclus nassatus]|uniref:Uncharacterized protein n=1 Tax=Cylicocyclus nassatus TaxID=53992 RepID=A0AA36GKM5_CYLNA|nr:unnamed protein product [Cylicocyclus nassatus]
MRYLTSVALLLFVLFGYLEAKPYPGRCRNRQVSKCAWKKMRQRRFPEPQDRLRVVWSSDGLVGNRYFERDGKHFLEIQELVPIGNGRYRIVSREEETTPPPAIPQPQEPSGAGSGPRSWMDELAAVPAWPTRVEDPRQSGARQTEPRLDEAPQQHPEPRPELEQVHPEPRPELAQVQPEPRPRPVPVQPETRPGVQAQAEPRPVPQQPHLEPREEDQSHVDDERQHPQSRVIEPAQPPVQPEPVPVRSEDRIPSGAEEPQREPQVETPSASDVVAVPIRQRTEDFPEIPAAYYDETWYEPPGQTFYPRLLYSPRYGWREMTQDEVSRVRSIRPISEHEESNGRDIHPQMELYPSQPQQNVQPAQQTHAEPKQDQKATILTQNLEQKEDEDSPNNILHGQQGTWIFRNDKWEFEPHGAVEIAETTPESVAPVYDSGTWVFDNGAWHYRPLSRPFEREQVQPDQEPRRPGQEQPQPNHERTQPDQEQPQPDQEQPQPDQEQIQPGQELIQTQPEQEQRISIPAVTVDENQTTGEKKLVKVKKFPRAPDHQDNHRELLAKAVSMEQEEKNENNGENDRDDYSRWYHSYRREQNDPQERENAWNAQDTKAIRLSDGQLPQPESAHYLQNGNMAAVVYSENDRKTEEDERNKSQGASYFLKEGNLGAYVYSGDENSSSAKEERNHQAPSPQRYLSADEYKRLQPSEVKVPTLQLKNPSDIKPCDGTGSTSGTGEFWLLRTRPCNRNSPEGRIMLPNGEILRFFGQPQLVNV